MIFFCGDLNISALPLNKRAEQVVIGGKKGSHERKQEIINLLNLEYKSALDLVAGEHHSIHDLVKHEVDQFCKDGLPVCTICDTQLDEHTAEEVPCDEVLTVNSEKGMRLLVDFFWQLHRNDWLPVHEMSSHKVCLRRELNSTRIEKFPAPPGRPYT